MAERSGMATHKRLLEPDGRVKPVKRAWFQSGCFKRYWQRRMDKIDRSDTHWLKGFYMAKVFHDADKVVQTCCLKTHRFGGHFTLSMKNSVGLVAKKVPGGMYDYMLGTSRIAFPASNDSGNQQQLQFGLCFDGWHKSLHNKRSRKWHLS